MRFINGVIVAMNREKEKERKRERKKKKKREKEYVKSTGRKK